MLETIIDSEKCSVFFKDEICYIQQKDNIFESKILNKKDICKFTQLFLDSEVIKTHYSGVMINFDKQTDDISFSYNLYILKSDFENLSDEYIFEKIQLKKHIAELNLKCSFDYIVNLKLNDKNEINIEVTKKDIRFVKTFTGKIRNSSISLSCIAFMNYLEITNDKCYFSKNDGILILYCNIYGDRESFKIQLSSCYN